MWGNVLLHSLVVSECVGSRDPYCVWSDDSLQCIQSPLMSSDGSSQATVDATL